MTQCLVNPETIRIFASKEHILFNNTINMKTNLRRFFVTCCMAAMALTGFAQNEEMTNETVLTLLKEGFSSEEIIGAIENSTDRKITYSIDFMRQLTLSRSPSPRSWSQANTASSIRAAWVHNPSRNTPSVLTLP